MKVIDCFSFFDEFLILDVRFRELYDVVDKFVVVEAAETFSGIPKPYYLSDCVSERYPQYADKIDIIKVPAKEFGNAWDREYFQKNHICKENLSYLGLDDSDLVLFSDADEIPRRSTVLHLRQYGSPEFGAGLLYKTYYYKFNVLTTEMCYRSKFVPYKNFTNHTEQRYIIQDVIPDAGWHFSYIKNPADIEKKIKAFSHQEFNTPDINKVDVITENIKSMSDLFGRPEMTMSCVPVDESFPEYVKENMLKLTEWIQEC